VTTASSPNSAAIAFSGVTKQFTTPKGDLYTAVHDLNFTIEPGEFFAIVGPSGCGKSTTLGMIAGLDRPSDGTVSVNGQLVDGIQPGVGYVFQSDAVFPWKNVQANVAAGPLFQGAKKEDANLRAVEWIQRVGLAGFEKHYPHQLSGGMRKRVSLAQTFIVNPHILLMDEPFSALDVQTRMLMEGELLDLWAGSSASVVFVTHDLEEAIALADRVCVLTAGPGTVKGIYPIDLPRPRPIAELRFDPQFTRLYQQIWNDLRDEVLISYERAKQQAQITA